MDITLNETQSLVQETARKFAGADLRPQAASRDESAEFPLESLAKMAGLGLMGVNIGGEYGGAEAGVVAYSLAVIEIAQGDPAVAVTMAVNNMVSEVIQQFGTSAQRERYIPRLTGGEYSSGSFCLSEPGSGSDAASMRTRAEKTSDGWSLSGAKAWVTSGAYAGVLLVWAKTRNTAGLDEISLFCVDPKADGVAIGKPEKKMGQHASNTVSIAFDKVELSDDALLGEPGQGFKIAMMALDGGRIGIASQAIGIGLEAFNQARAYAVERRQFGKRIADFQAIQFKLADIATELEAARLLTMRAAWLKEQASRPFSREASMAKLYASEAACRACDQAIQILGGYGYTREYPVEKLFRDVRVTRIYEGTNEIQRIVIARDLIRQS
ncbi:MAG: acyl-CoA dehydrogenase family protein [Bradymonadaceae bacterium]|nr:acyl-CoA dehydrogenase family protein [Lujinxingiaceae bacterium]